MKVNTNIQNRLGKLENQNKTTGRGSTKRGETQGGTGSEVQGQRQFNPNHGPHRNNQGCFRCGQWDHFIRDCPYPVVMGQLQVSSQPMSLQPSSFPSINAPAFQSRNVQESGSSANVEGRPVPNHVQSPLSN